MTHVAWNCDGKKLAAVGIDKVTRVWMPEKSVSAGSILLFVLGTYMASSDGTQGCYNFHRRTF
jgi:hypothetical protein